MDEYSQKLLEYIFATQVIILANQLQGRARSHGQEVSGDMISEAVQLIEKKADYIFAQMKILA
ncbi:MAG: hypothetical protein AB1896_13115 [Thermodesulfobacteriota bacterium]